MTSIYYITRINFFSDRAHVFTISKTCEALNSVPGMKVTLVSTDDSVREGAELARYFQEVGVRRLFAVKSLDSLANKFKHGGTVLFRLSFVFANLTLVRFLWKERKNIDALYFRDHLLILPILFGKIVLGKPVVYESHYILEKPFSQLLTSLSVRLSDGVVAITQAIADHYKPVVSRMIVSVCAASEPERFAAIVASKDELRAKLGLPADKFILGYTGNMSQTGIGDSYGLEDVVRAIPLLSERVILVAVGKKPGQYVEGEAEARRLGLESRAFFLSWTDRHTAAEYVKAFDALVVPVSGGKPGNSPTKMFEYLAAGRPIIAAHTGPIAEVLHDGGNALLTDYQNPDSWKAAVGKIMEDSSLAESLVRNATSDARQYTWEKRGETIGNFINLTVAHVRS